MRGILFERVVVTYTDGKPHPVKPVKEPSKVLGSNDYACAAASGCSVGSVPAPPCLAVVAPGAALPPYCF
jgi:hypothetical protein